MLRTGSRAGLLIAGRALYGSGLAAAGRIAAATGAKLLAPYAFTRIGRGAGTAVVERIPYVLEQAAEKLKEFRQLILVGAPAPVAYFAYPGKNSVPVAPECEVHTLVRPGEDCVGALDSLATALSPRGAQPLVEEPERPPLPSGEITLPGLAAVVAALLPEDAIVVDESMPSGRGMMAAARGAPPHDWLANTGGSIAIAMPLAVWAGVACPDRRGLCPSADGNRKDTAPALLPIARRSAGFTPPVLAYRALSNAQHSF